MAALPYIQLYVSDYLADTMHLTTEEHGAYLLLIMNYWQTGKPIPKSRLQKIARLDNDRWPSVEDSLSEFFSDNGSEWVHSRIEDDLADVRDAQAQRVAAGKASAAAKKRQKREQNKRESNDRSTPVEDSLEREVNDSPTNTDTDTDTDTDKGNPDPKPEPKKSKPSRKSKTSPFPEDFEITQGMADWFREKNLTIDMHAATEKWKNSMLANGRVYTDWAAAWRNGMTLAQEWSERDRANNVTQFQRPQSSAGPKKLFPGIKHAPTGTGGSQ